MKIHDFKLWCRAFVLASLLAGCGGVEGGGDAGEGSNLEAARAPLTTAAQGRVTPEKHCVARVQSVKPGEPLPEPSVAPAMDCFSTFAESISFATHGAVRLPPTAKPADFKEEDLKAVAPSAGLDFPIAVAFTGPNFTGNSVVFLAVENCGGILYPTLSPEWNDAISSEVVFSGSGCHHSWHYENAYFSGSVADCGTACSYIGDAMNKRTSSIFWTQ